jgi:hypothetical protein
MNEDFLQYLWEHKLFRHKNCIASTGEKLEIIDVGEHNSNAGPDFLNARIKIGDTLWAGNVEVHSKTSDWNKHNHHNDKSFDNVILHVVGKNDCVIMRSGGEIIPALELTYNKKLVKNYHSLLLAKSRIPCDSHLKNIEPFIFRSWLDKMAVERLQKKSSYIHNILAQHKNNWEEVFYQILARNFGFGINAEPFEMLAKSLPYHYLAKHKNNHTQVEALLFGQAGFLNDTKKDNYALQLAKEYRFLKQKYALVPIERHLWKFLRLRPANFPTIRLSQFSNLIYHTNGLFSRIIEEPDIFKVKEYFKLQTSEYWENHYLFDKPSTKRRKKISESSIQIILINTIAPFLFVYGDSKDQPVWKEKALDLLEHIPGEKNHITAEFAKSGIKVNNAFESQAIIHLKNEYCSKKGCLKCQIGAIIIAKEK